MKHFWTVLWIVLVVIIGVILFPFYLIKAVWEFIITMIKLAIECAPGCIKGNKNKDSEEKSDEESQNCEEPNESVFEDMGV